MENLIFGYVAGSEEPPANIEILAAASYKFVSFPLAFGVFYPSP
jgi:hypothetical protein